jgi:hypothetical protein
LGLALISGCATPADDSAAGNQAIIADANSLIRRADGRFDVTCKASDGSTYKEVRTEKEVLDNTICTGPVTTITMSRFDFRNTYHFGQQIFGQTSWEGFASFRLNIADCIVSDGSGTVHDGAQFSRLATPVSIQCAIGGGVSWATMDDVTLEVTKINPITYSAKYRDRPDQSDKYLEGLGSDLAGITATFDVRATFFKNFSNGNACSTIRLVDADKKEVVLTANAPTLSVQVKYPVTVSEVVTCSSELAAQPENDKADYELDIDHVVFH